MGGKEVVESVCVMVELNKGEKKTLNQVWNTPQVKV